MATIKFIWGVTQVQYRCMTGGAEYMPITRANSLEHYKVKSRIYIYILLVHLSPNIHSVLLYDQPFSRYKVVQSWKCTEWTQNDLEHLTVENTLYLLKRPKFWSNSLYDQPFSRYNTNYNSPLTIMLPPHPKKKSNIKSLKFHNSPDFFFWEGIWCVLSEEMSFEFFPPICRLVSKTHCCKS